MDRSSEIRMIRPRSPGSCRKESGDRDDKYADSLSRGELERVNGILCARFLLLLLILGGALRVFFESFDTFIAQSTDEYLISAVERVRSQLSG